ncbi:hypothetical protein L7F22_020139 [Adiantum nelumboides]|nr:hypothetical protein [Adiantum nelumboides]
MGGVQTEYATVPLQEGGREISIFARLFKPPLAAAEAPGKGWTVVLVHQYSVLGGCQALLKGTATSLALKGFLSITFDMRGVKRSTGKSFWTGSSEVQDVVAVCHWAARQYPDHRILLVGSSAGMPACTKYNEVLLLVHVNSNKIFQEIHSRILFEDILWVTCNSYT